MVKCVKCHRESTFTSPSAFCDMHWVLWSTEGYEEIRPDLDATETRVQDLKGIWKRHGRPDDADSQLREIKKA